MGSGIGTILASIGIPLAVDLIKKMTDGSAPRFGRSPLQGKQDGHGAPRLGMYEPPPPFIGTWEQMHGGGKKKKRTRTGHALLLGKNSPFKNIPLLNLIL